MYRIILLVQYQVLCIQFYFCSVCVNVCNRACQCNTNIMMLMQTIGIVSVYTGRCSGIYKDQILVTIIVEVCISSTAGISTFSDAPAGRYIFIDKVLLVLENKTVE